MDLFGIGTPELLVIVLIGLLVLGPVRMSQAAKNAGRAMRRMRRELQDVDPRRLVEEPLRDALNDIDTAVTDDDEDEKPVKPRKFGDNARNKATARRPRPAPAAPEQTSSQKPPVTKDQ